MQLDGKFRILGCAALECAGGALVLSYFFCKLRAFDPVYETLYFRSVPLWWTGLFFVIALLLFFSGRSWEECRKRAIDYLPLPFAGLLVLLRFDSILPLLGALLLTAWGIYRYASRLGQEECDEPQARGIAPRTGMMLALLLGAAGVGFSIYLQQTAYKVLFLFFHDWGEYAVHYLNLAFSGEATFHDWISGGGHFNPLMNLIMGTAIRLFPAAETIFFMNGLMIYSAVPLIYCYGRELKLPVQTALFFAAAFFLAPVVSNQSLSLFYGFHPINLQPSLILLFFLFRARRQTGMAMVFLLLTLLVQETAAIFWFGYGLYLLLKRDVVRGALLCAGMVLFFLAATRWFIPSAGEPGSGNYIQLFHYSQLGGTISEVLLSPLLRPAAFWGTLFSLNNLVFVLMLILPMAFFLPKKLPLLVIGVPMLAGVCLQSSRDLQNVVLQYGVELNALVMTTAVAGAAIMFKKGDRRKLFGALAAALFGVIALHLLAGKTLWWGKYPFAPVAERPDASELVEFLKAKLPPGVTVHASPRIRAHLMFDFPTRKLSSPVEAGSFLLFSLRPETMSAEELNAFRHRLAADHSIVPITSANWNDLEYVMFAKLPEPRPRQPLPFLRPISLEEFSQFGARIPCEKPELEIRCRLLPEGALFGFRLNERAKTDLRFRITLSRPGESLVKELHFANGLYPADTLEPGTVFFVQLPALPSGMPQQIRVEALP